MAANPPNPPESPDPDTEYAINERVLCYHGPLIYEAKVLKMEDHPDDPPVDKKSHETGMHYFVHYKGWKQTWDEWVPWTRLLKWNEAHVDYQKYLHSEARMQLSAGSASGSGAKGKTPAAGGVGKEGRRKDVHGGGTRGTKRAREDDDGAKKAEMRLEVPEILKSQLVDDWEMVTKNCQLVPLPRDPTVEQILNDFETYTLKEKPAGLRKPEVLATTVTHGLKVYFDKSLGNQLLYRNERVQYSGVRREYITGQHVKLPQDNMSAIYGAEHLLRMLVSLPGMIAQTNLDPDSVNIIRDYVHELFRYMVRNRPELFLDEYEVQSLAYQNESKA